MEATKNFINSTFITSLIGALAGAYFGATAAQRIAERSKYREELLREMRNTNAAIALAFEVSDALLALKKQHVKSLKEIYDAKKADLIEFMRKRDAGEISQDLVFDFKADLETLQPQVLPMDTLRAVVFERLSIVGRALNLVVTLNQTVESLAESLAKRNSLIESYKVEVAKDKQRLVPLYFGLPFEEGLVNREYPDMISAIYSQTDAGIFFGSLLCKDLHEHGQQLSNAFKKKFKNDPHRIHEVDFGPAVADGLMPDEKNYADWLTGFVKKAG
jgi:hypothetical protein